MTRSIFLRSSHRCRCTLALLLVGLFVPSFAALAGSLPSEPLCGDVNDSGMVTSGDALAVLRRSVGLEVTLECPPLGTTLQTGQTSCHDVDGTSIDCAATSQDGEVQAGVSRSFTDNGDGTITDHATGLMWEKLSNDGSIHDRDFFSDWINAFAKVDDLNSAGFAGHDDWRLPNQFELFSLLNLGPGAVTVYPVFNTSCQEGCTVLTCSCVGTEKPTAYWSSTTYLNETSGKGAWAVMFDSGFTAAVDKSFGVYVRAVRDAS